MADDFYDDAHLCTSMYPGDDTHVGQLCHEQAGHEGDHQAIAELGPGWRRYITWPAAGTRQDGARISPPPA